MAIFKNCILLTQTPSSWSSWSSPPSSITKKWVSSSPSHYMTTSRNVYHILPNWRIHITHTDVDPSHPIPSHDSLDLPSPLPKMEEDRLSFHFHFTYTYTSIAFQPASRDFSLFSQRRESVWEWVRGSNQITWCYNMIRYDPIWYDVTQHTYIDDEDEVRNLISSHPISYPISHPI